MNLFIVSNKDIGLITLNLILPLKIKRINSSGDLPVKIDADKNIVVNEKVYPYIEDTINEINIVLKKIIPNLQLKLEMLKKEIVNEDITNIIADLHSVRDGDMIPIKYSYILSTNINSKKVGNICLKKLKLILIKKNFLF